MIVPIKFKSKISDDSPLPSRKITCTCEISTHFHCIIKSGYSFFYVPNCLARLADKTLNPLKWGLDFKSCPVRFLWNTDIVGSTVQRKILGWAQTTEFILSPCTGILLPLFVTQKILRNFTLFLLQQIVNRMATTDLCSEAHPNTVLVLILDTWIKFLLLPQIQWLN